jgi:hypothetical protein
MTLKLSLPHGVFSLVREMPGNLLLFRSEVGQTMLLSESEILHWLSSGVAKLIEPTAQDCWDAWGRPEILINDEGTGWGVE